MRRRASEPTPSAPTPIPTGEKVVVGHDLTGEALIIAAAIADPAIAKQLTRRLVPDHFQSTEARNAWGVLVSMQQRNLTYDHGLATKLGGEATARLMEHLRKTKPSAPANVQHYVQQLLWDATRVRAAKGPLPSFLDALKDPKGDPARVKSLANALAKSFDTAQDQKHLRDPDQIAAEVMRDIEERIAGRAFYPFGIPDLDFFDAAARDQRGNSLEGQRRMVPGAAPGQITVVTGSSGIGKSTFTLNLILGLMTQGRKVLYGTWEQGPKISVELLACMRLGWNRTDLRNGVGAIREPGGRQRFEEELHALTGKVRILENAFKRVGGERTDNMRNLDILQGYLNSSGCDVFVGDLWKRAIKSEDPASEEEALIRQQAMAEEEQVHCILLQQQRLKDIELRADTRPTRDGIKGTAAWVEVADTIIGVYRQGAMGAFDDDKLEAIIMKQRYGRSPQIVEFEWDGDKGTIGKGRTMPIVRPGDASETQAPLAGAKRRGRKFGG